MRNTQTHYGVLHLRAKKRKETNIFLRSSLKIFNSSNLESIGSHPEHLHLPDCDFYPTVALLKITVLLSFQRIRKTTNKYMS